METSFSQNLNKMLDSFLSFLPDSYATFIKTHKLFSILAIVFLTFFYSFFVTPVFLHINMDTYSEYQFEGATDTSKKITIYGLLSEKKIQTFLGVSLPKEAPTVKPKPETKSTGLTTRRESLLTGGNFLSKEDFGKASLYSKLYVFGQIGLVLLLLLCTYFIRSRWSLLGMVFLWVWMTTVHYIKMYFVQDYFDFVMITHYRDEHNIFAPKIYSEGLFSWCILFLTVISIYYFIRSFKKGKVEGNKEKINS